MRPKISPGKKKRDVQSATYTDNAFTFRDGQLTLAKQQEPLPIVWSRPLPEGVQPSSVTVSQDRTGRYFVSLLVEEEIAPLAPTEKAVGIDLGLKSFLVTSDGETIANARYYARDEKKLARAQRRHALEELTLELCEWVYPSCRACHDRDRNAAQNILCKGLAAAGQAADACGG